MDKYTESTSIIDSHVGHYMTAYAVEWCLDNGWSPDDLADIRSATAAYMRDGQAMDDDLWEILHDALNDAEEWATENLTDDNHYFGNDPDIGDWGVWEIDDEV